MRLTASLEGGRGQASLREMLLLYLTRAYTQRRLTTGARPPSNFADKVAKLDHFFGYIRGRVRWRPVPGPTATDSRVQRLTRGCAVPILGVRTRCCRDTYGTEAM